MTRQRTIFKKEAEILEMLRKGIMTRQEIADAVGLSRSSVDRVAQQNGLGGLSIAEKAARREIRVKHAVEMYNNGKTAPQIAEEMKLCVTTVNNYLYAAGRRIRDNYETSTEKAARLHQSGATVLEISRHLHRNKQTVLKYLRNAKNRHKMACSQCGSSGHLERFRGQLLCCDCLLKDDRPISTEYALETNKTASNWEF